MGRAGEVRRCGEHPILQSSLGDRTGQDGVKHTDPSRTQDRPFSDMRGGKQLRGWFPVVHTQPRKEEGILGSYGKRVRLS